MTAEAKLDEDLQRVVSEKMQEIETSSRDDFSEVVDEISKDTEISERTSERAVETSGRDESRESVSERAVETSGREESGVDMSEQAEKELSEHPEESVSPPEQETFSEESESNVKTQLYLKSPVLMILEKTIVFAFLC